MKHKNLLINKSDVYSQNGEDGIIAAIFDKIGTTTKICCEFGAWDGIHLSNCRKLIVEGWQALLIEGNRERFSKLTLNYRANPLAICENRFVDSGPNSIGTILRANNLGELDFLSIDIDGLDYEILETLDVRPRVICIEVNAGHSPDRESSLDRDIAQRNVGQPLSLFLRVAEEKGYDLVCYNANAFFVRRDVREASSLQVLSGKQAYQYFLEHLSMPAKEWLYLVNLGLVEPYFMYSNEYLTRHSLGISHARALTLMFVSFLRKNVRSVRNRVNQDCRYKVFCLIISMGWVT